MISSTENGGALAGVRVIDLSRVLGGPSCTQVLADHGADVIKVEPPGGDETRERGPPFETDDDGDKVSSSYFNGVNRNKRCIALNLTTDQGREVLFRLLETADVLVENFKAGTLEKWGMGYEDVLKGRFARLVHCRITGFGVDGPLGGYPGYDAALQAITGLFSINGAPDSGPTRFGTPVVDLVTGLNSVIGICMALIERERSGLGQQIDITLYDTGVSLLFPHGSNWFMSGKLPVRTGNAHTNVIPYDLFPTRTQPLFLAIGNNGQFRRLVEVLGKPELADDPRYASNGDRSHHRDELTAELTALLADWDGEELNQKLLECGVPSGSAHNVAEVLEHPHTHHRNMIYEKDGYQGIGAPVKLSRTPPSLRTRPMPFGSDNESVLAEAGYSEAEIEALIGAGTVLTQRAT